MESRRHSPYSRPHAFKRRSVTRLASRRATGAVKGARVRRRALRGKDHKARGPSLALPSPALSAGPSRHGFVRLQRPQAARPTRTAVQRCVERDDLGRTRGDRETPACAVQQFVEGRRKVGCQGLMAGVPQGTAERSPSNDRHRTARRPSVHRRSRAAPVYRIAAIRPIHTVRSCGAHRRIFS